VRLSLLRLVGTIHDRMSVILNPAAYDLWLDPEAEDAKKLEALLVPYPSEAMTAYPVSTRVNNPKADDLRCIGPMAWLRSLLIPFSRRLRSYTDGIPSRIRTTHTAAAVYPIWADRSLSVRWCPRNDAGVFRTRQAGAGRESV
jgi:hypothetical protein